MKKTLVLLTSVLILASFSAVSGELGALTKKEPLVLHGSTSASFNFNASSESFATRSPVDWNLYGNYTMQIFGIDLPFSFIINQYSQSYTHPFTQFGISPEYKWAKLHLGISNIRLSQVSSTGHVFNGIGLELTPGKFRFSAFYGSLSMNGNNDTVRGPYERPEYSGIGYGAKLGIGSTDKSLDLSYFHGQVDRSYYSIDNNQNLVANEVIGVDYKIKLLSVLSVTGSFAVSGSTKAQREAGNDPDPAGKSPSKYKGIFSTYHSRNIPAWALESAFSLDLKNFRSVLSYRNIRPDFKSFGTPERLNDGQTISITSGLSLAKGKLNINTMILEQSNTENRESAGELTALFITDNKTITGNLNILSFINKDIITGEYIQNKNLSASLNYDWRLTEKATNLSFAASYNHYAQTGSSFSSLGATAGAGLHLLKTNKMILNGTIGYAFNNNSPGDSKGNITFSCNAVYNPGRNSFNFFVNYSVIPNDKRYNIIDYLPYKTTTHNLTAGISYTSSF
jgi:hypothetical protein